MIKIFKKPYNLFTIPAFPLFLLFCAMYVFYQIRKQGIGIMIDGTGIDVDEFLKFRDRHFSKTLEVIISIIGWFYIVKYIINF